MAAVGVVSENPAGGDREVAHWTSMRMVPAEAVLKKSADTTTTWPAAKVAV